MRSVLPSNHDADSLQQSEQPGCNTPLSGAIVSKSSLVRQWVVLHRFVSHNAQVCDWRSRRKHVPDKHRAYGMNGVMPIKPFVHKPLCRALHWDLVTKRNLILDNGMHHGVDLGVRQTDTRPTVKVLHQPKALPFVKVEPLLRIGCLKRIVAIDHGAMPSCWLPA
jgi:hypothetical protein